MLVYFKKKKKEKKKDGCFGILTIIGYLMPNPVYTYIRYL